MPDASVTPEAADEAEFVATLRGAGGAATNPNLIDRLGWDPARYWAVRNRLRDQGRVQKRLGGPGGTTFIPELQSSATGVGQPPTTTDPIAPANEVGERESDLYGPMLSVLETSWVRDQGYDSHIVRKTALAGGRNTGGTWTRPDLCVVAIRKFKFLRDPVFDVVSFEVKPNWAISVGGIFEALAHRQSATRSYVIYHTSERDFDEAPEAERIIGLAEQHGIGVFLAASPDNWNEWTERVRARRWTPDPIDLNEFLQRVFPASDHDEIIKLAK